LVNADKPMQVVDFPHPRGLRCFLGKAGKVPGVWGRDRTQRTDMTDMNWHTLPSRTRDLRAGVVVAGGPVGWERRRNRPLELAWARLNPLGLAWRGGGVKRFLRGNGDTVTQTTQRTERT
jgi:hypothetical protein